MIRISNVKYLQTKARLKKQKKEHAEWVYGYYFPLNGKHYVLSGNEKYEVIPETICPFMGYTGNNKKVYYGDIVNNYQEMPNLLLKNNHEFLTAYFTYSISKKISSVDIDVFYNLSVIDTLMNNTININHELITNDNYAINNVYNNTISVPEYTPTSNIFSYIGLNNHIYVEEFYTLLPKYEIIGCIQKKPIELGKITQKHLKNTGLNNLTKFEEYWDKSYPTRLFKNNEDTIVYKYTFEKISS